MDEQAMRQDGTSGSREDQAVSWFVRLQECDDEAVWLAHREWLEATPANAAAYDAVEALWVDVDALREREPDREDVSAPVIDLAERRTSRRRVLVWVPAAAAAALVAMVAGPQASRLLAPASETFRTDATHAREVALADGSRLTLGRNTEVSVRFSDAERGVTLASGQAAFDVRHDSSRPFVISAGDRDVRVLGTEFDVLRRDGAFGVSVRRGLVSVSDAADAGAVTRLPAGKALLRLRGESRDRVSDVDLDNALAWRDGRLTYMNSTLAKVAQDYQRYVGKPVSVARDARDLHVSGVVTARDEDDLIRQLELLLPIRILRTEAGREIVKR